MYVFHASDGIHWVAHSVVPAGKAVSDGANIYHEPDGSYTQYVKLNLPAGTFLG